MDNIPPRVQLVGISKRYPGVQALDHVTFSVSPGCIHAIVGENGAGKSTLLKILAGATLCDSGLIHIDGEPVQISNVRGARAHGIAVVHQELSLAEELTVSENVFLGNWPRRPLGVISFSELHLRAENILRSLGVNITVRQKVASLSLAQQQLVEIARGFVLEPRVLLLDEPSAILTPREMTGMFDLIRSLAARGVSVVYVTHRLDEVFSLADHVTVLRDGKHISTCPINMVNRDSLIREMVGRPIEQEFPTRIHALGEVRLRVRELCAGRRVKNVSFDVRGGEVFALTGLVGSGRSSVGKALFGCIPGLRGHVAVGEKIGPFRSPRVAKLAGIAFVPEDRKAEGLLLERSLLQNMTLAHLQNVSKFGIMLPRREHDFVRKGIAKFGIKTNRPSAAVNTLSGGNQQKVMIARWLQEPYCVMILDEPTRGIDVGAKAEIYTLINRISAEGTAVILITSELPEAIGLADRIGVMNKGRLTGIFDNRNREVTQESIMELAVR